MDSRRAFYVVSIFAALTVLSLGSARYGAGATAAGTAPVTVMNTAGNPVPTAAQGTTQISGSVAVTSMPAVQLGLGNTIAVSSLPAVQLANGTSVGVSSLPAVQLANGTSVGVSNDAAHAIPVHEVSPAGPVLIEAEAAVGIFNAAGGQALVYTVPQGKRFIVQTLRGSSKVPGGPLAWPKILRAGLFCGSATYFPYEMLMTNTGKTGADQQVYTGVVTSANYVFESGDTVIAFAELDGQTTEAMNVDIAMVGYLVDAP